MYKTVIMPNVNPSLDPLPYPVSPMSYSASVYSKLKHPECIVVVFTISNETQLFRIEDISNQATCFPFQHGGTTQSNTGTNQYVSYQRVSYSLHFESSILTELTVHYTRDTNIVYLVTLSAILLNFCKYYRFRKLHL